MAKTKKAAVKKAAGKKTGPAKGGPKKGGSKKAGPNLPDGCNTPEQSAGQHGQPSRMVKYDGQ